jgi:hypothetical protein
MKARTVEPEKQTLLANGSETTFTARQRIHNEQYTRPLLGNAFTNKHVPTETTSSTKGELLEAVLNVASSKFSRSILLSIKLTEIYSL